MIAATIFMCIFVILGGVVMYLSKTIEHGEARFDSETGKVIDDGKPVDKGPVRPATRLKDNDETTGKDV
ncbi:MAG: hypothetical protein AAF687_08520 [Pseudomonadota bacterium]